MNPDYSSYRVDSFHQFLFPHTYFGWLSIVPSIGFRGTYYSNTGNFTEADPSNPIPEGNLNEQGGQFRFAVNADVEASFKLSRLFEGVQARWLGLDGFATYSNPTPTFPGIPNPRFLPYELLQFDQYIPSTKLQAITFPQFLSIDSLDRWTILRLGVRNRLQTRRDSATINWLDIDTYFDVDFDNPIAQAGSAIDHQRLSNQSAPPTKRAFLERLQPGPIPTRTMVISFCRFSGSHTRQRILGGKYDL